VLLITFVLVATAFLCLKRAATFLRGERVVELGDDLTGEVV
jgi:hypothetical protein